MTEKIYLNGVEIKKISRPASGTVLLERYTSKIFDSAGPFALIHRWNIDLHQRETSTVTDVKTHYQISNHLGSSSLELDAQANLISYEEYFPFGGTAFLAGSNTTDISLKEYRYCRKERDNATGFYYYGYRYFVSWMGRWLNPDPIGPKDGLNLYRFVHNNPITLTEPNGLKSSSFNFGSSAKNKEMGKHPAGVQRLVSQMRPRAQRLWFKGKMRIGSHHGSYYAFTNRFRFALWWNRAQGRGENFFVFTDKLLSMEAAARQTGTAKHNRAGTQATQSTDAIQKQAGQKLSSQGKGGGGDSQTKKPSDGVGDGAQDGAGGKTKNGRPVASHGDGADDSGTGKTSDAQSSGSTASSKTGENRSQGGQGRGSSSASDSGVGRHSSEIGSHGVSGEPGGSKGGTAKKAVSGSLTGSGKKAPTSKSDAKFGQKGVTYPVKLKSLDKLAVKFELNLKKWKTQPNKITNSQLKYAYTSRSATKVAGNVKLVDLWGDVINLSSFTRDFQANIRITSRDNRLSAGQKALSFAIGFADSLLLPVGLVYGLYTRSWKAFTNPLSTFYQRNGMGDFFSAKSGWHTAGSLVGMVFDIAVGAILLKGVLTFTVSPVRQTKRLWGSFSKTKASKRSMPSKYNQTAEQAEYVNYITNTSEQ